MKLFTDWKGQGIVEFTLLLVFIALLVLVSLSLIGTSIGNVFSTLITSF